MRFNFLFNSDPTFIAALKERKALIRKSRGLQRNKLTDIHDGLVYQKLVADCPAMLNDYNLTFSINTDGVALFSASNMTCWPVYLIINELPARLR